MNDIKKVIVERLLSVVIVGSVCSVYLGRTAQAAECAGVLIVLSSISQQYFHSFWGKYYTRSN